MQRENISDHDILPLAKCYDILSLGLAGCPLSEDTVVKILLVNPHIKSINVSSISTISDKAIRDIVSVIWKLSI